MLGWREAFSHFPISLWQKKTELDDICLTRADPHGFCALVEQAAAALVTPIQSSRGVCW